MYGAAMVMLIVLCVGACSRSAETAKEYEMGNAAVAGPLSYTVINTEWRESLDGASGPTIPAHKYLLVSVSVTNKSAGEVSIPLLLLVDSSGKEYRESDKGDGVPEWLGLLRSVAPSQTDSGNLLFDVPPGSYKLRVSSGGDLEKETTALVNLPYRVEPPPVKLPTRVSRKN